MVISSCRKEKLYLYIVVHIKDMKTYCEWGNI